MSRVEHKVYQNVMNTTSRKHDRCRSKPMHELEDRRMLHCSDASSARGSFRPVLPSASRGCRSLYWKLTGAQQGCDWADLDGTGTILAAICRLEGLQGDA